MIYFYVTRDLYVAFRTYLLRTIADQVFGIFREVCGNVSFNRACQGKAQVGGGPSSGSP